MKKSTRSGYKFVWLVPLLSGILLCSSASAQYYEKSRHVSKAFAVDKETEIQVSNKYGTVHLMPWDKDSVRFEIDLVVKAKKESKVDKVFNYIDFSFTATRYYVIAQTEISKSTFWTEVSDAASALFSSDNKAEIDYTVYYPKGNPVKVSNKFGNIYTTDHFGKLDIQLSNGDLKAHDLEGDIHINLEFGNASINRLSKGNLTINYSEISLTDVDYLNYTGKSSTLHIDKVREMIINSRRDKFNIKQLEKLNGESSFSNFRIRECQNTVIVKTEYGEFFLDGTGKSFSLLKLNSEFTDIQLSFPKTVAIDLEIEHDDRTVISYPEAFKDIKQQARDQKEESWLTYGRIGSSSSAAAKVNISNKAGAITIKSK
jgi:hypothetical protein